MHHLITSFIEDFVIGFVQSKRPDLLIYFNPIPSTQRQKHSNRCPGLGQIGALGN